MILSLSGYIGSGKDTVAQVIQEVIIRTSNDPMCKHAELSRLAIQGREHLSGWQIKKWATKLKLVASMLTGIPVEKFEDQEFKKSELSEQWDYIGPSIASGPIVTCDLKQKKMTVREFLQRLGTDAVRNNLHTNTWVNSLMVDYKRQPHNGPTRDLKFPNWLVTDTRFSNEAAVIKEAGGINIRINRKDNPYIQEGGPHISETALDDFPFDYYINNDGTLEDLAKEVTSMLRAFGIIRVDVMAA